MEMTRNERISATQRQNWANPKFKARWKATRLRSHGIKLVEAAGLQRWKRIVDRAVELHLDLGKGRTHDIINRLADEFGSTGAKLKNVA
jgi:hypothetical protein